MHIKIGTRASKLAMWQSQYVADQLKKHYPKHTFELVTIQTKGDRIQDVALQKIGDKGLFVKEIEEQLLNGEIQLAIHSMKDMPSTLPKGLIFSKTLWREDARDVLVLREGEHELKKHAVVGCGSVRRIAQLKRLRDDVMIKGIRGNVDTRLAKLDRGDYDAILLASAGLKRLGLEHRISSYFEVEDMIPACAQGALAVELREDAAELLDMLNALHDETSHTCVCAERYVLKEMGGSCHIPIGVCCQKNDQLYRLDAVFGEHEETIRFFHGSGSDAMQLAQEAVCALRKGE